MQFTEAIREFEGQPLTRQILLSLLRDYKSPSDKITELVKKGILTLVKAKIYVPGSSLNMRGPEPGLLANHIASPSYLSMHTALSYWRLIPERVFEVTSAILGRSRVYDTVVGRFRYTSLPLPYYSFGQTSVQLSPGQTALMAIPEKALCDTVIVTSGLLFRSIVHAKEWIIEDMRMDADLLSKINSALIRDWISEAPKKESLNQLVKALESL